MIYVIYGTEDAYFFTYFMIEELFQQDYYNTFTELLYIMYACYMSRNCNLCLLEITGIPNLSPGNWTRHV